MQVMKGALDVFKGKEIEYTVEEQKSAKAAAEAQPEEERDQIWLLHRVHHYAGQAHEPGE